MKLFFDFFPILLFFVAYKLRGIYAATGVMMVASFLQISAFWLKNRRFEKLHIWTFVIIMILGGATLILHDPVFIKWKPSIVNWGLAIVFLGSQFIGERPLVQRMLGTALEMPSRKWLRLNLAWIVFFVACGVANIVVAYSWTENAWVNFKLFGLTALSMVFMFGQIFLLREHLVEVAEPAEAPPGAG
jgi:intracellular septation protein